MSDFIKKLHGFLKAASKKLGLLLSSAYTWIFILAASGVSAVCYGVLLLSSPGFALITLGAFLLLITSVIARGAANG